MLNQGIILMLWINSKIQNLRWYNGETHQSFTRDPERTVLEGCPFLCLWHEGDVSRTDRYKDRMKKEKRKNTKTFKK